MSNLFCSPNLSNHIFNWNPHKKVCKLFVQWESANDILSRLLFFQTGRNRAVNKGMSTSQDRVSDDRSQSQHRSSDICQMAAAAWSGQIHKQVWSLRATGILCLHTNWFSVCTQDCLERANKIFKASYDRKSLYTPSQLLRTVFPNFISINSYECMEEWFRIYTWSVFNIKGRVTAEVVWNQYLRQCTGN